MPTIRKMPLPQVVVRALFYTRQAIERKLSLASGITAQVEKIMTARDIKSLIADQLMKTCFTAPSLQDLLQNALLVVESVEAVEWSDTLTKDTKTTGTGAARNLLADVTIQKIKSATVAITVGQRTQRVVVPLNFQCERVNREWWE